MDNGGSQGEIEGTKGRNVEKITNKTKKQSKKYGQYQEHEQVGEVNEKQKRKTKKCTQTDSSMLKFQWTLGFVMFLDPQLIS